MRCEKVTWGGREARGPYFELQVIFRADKKIGRRTGGPCGTVRCDHRRMPASLSWRDGRTWASSTRAPARAMAILPSLLRRRFRQPFCDAGAAQRCRRIARRRQGLADHHLIGEAQPRSGRARLDGAPVRAAWTTSAPSGCGACRALRFPAGPSARCRARRGAAPAGGHRSRTCRSAGGVAAVCAVADRSSAIPASRRRRLRRRAVMTSGGRAPVRRRRADDGTSCLSG